MAEQVNIDLSDTSARSPGLLPTGTPGVRSRNPFMPQGMRKVQDMMNQIRAKAKQALPAAPATVPPDSAPVPWVKYGLIGAAVVVGFKLFSGKKGSVRHG